MLKLVSQVDVEGFEASGYRGMKETLLRKYPPRIVIEFCDWAEARVPGEQGGDAQRILIDCGYRLWTLDAFPARCESLQEPVTAGFAMLGASREDR